MTQTTPTVIGRYQILKSIGGGGMGSLFLARDPKIGNRHVAIKLLREGFDSPELRERFTREADAAGGLHHVNIVTIFDVGEFDGQPFIAMEYIEGETLTDVINRRAALPLGRKLQLMEELCAGLRYAHRAGIVHRDSKPANIMIDQEGVLKILDFGIARLGSSSMTKTGMVIGTLNYMAPEQMAGQPVDARADIFSAGALFYELLSYRRAFPGELPGIVHKIMTATRDPLATLVPELDANLVAVVDRCMAREPEDRYADMATVRRDISALRQRIVLDDMKNIGARIDEARRAMEQREFQAAFDACGEALHLDSENTGALELQQQARIALNEQQAVDWLTQARDELQRGELTAASVLVDRAVSLTGSFPEARAVRQAVDEARLQIAQAQARAQAVEAALTRAQRALDASALDEARDAVDEALGLDPAHRDAAALKEHVVAALQARHQADEDFRAQGAVEAARAQCQTGNYTGALAILNAFQPAHPVVAAALEDIRGQAQEAERSREEERRRQDEAAQQRAAATIQIDPPKAKEPPSGAGIVERTVVATRVAPVPPAPPAQTLRLEQEPVATPPLAASRSKMFRPWQLGAAAIAALVIVGAIVLSTGRTPAPPEPPAAAAVVSPTAVMFQVSPWATVDSIIRKADGQSVGGAGLVTPCVVALPPGEYHVKASNPNFPPLEFDLTVKSAESQSVRYQMPGFDPQKEINAIVGQ